MATEFASTLTELNRIGQQLKQQAMSGDISTTLKRCADYAAQVTALLWSTDSPPAPSVVIWLYDAERKQFDPTLRVASGEPLAAPIEDWPRPDGFGQRALQTQQAQYSAQTHTLHPRKRQHGFQTVACYPLTANQQTVGVLYIYRSQVNTFEPFTLSLLENFVNTASTVIYHNLTVADLTRALTHKTDKLEKLRLISQRINNQTDFDRLLRETLSLSLTMLAAQYGSLDLYDKRAHRLSLHALSGAPNGTQITRHLPIDETSVVGWVATHREPLLIHDLSAPSWQTLYHPLPTEVPMRSELAVPLIGADGALEGVLNVESDLPQAFTTDDQQLLEMIASQAVISLREMRLLDALQQIFTALLQANQADLFSLIVDWACDLTNTPAGTIWRLNEKSDTLTVQYSTAADQVGDERPFAGSLTERAIRFRQPITVSDIRPFLPNRPQPASERWISAIVVPLLLPNDGQPLGSFIFLTDQLRDFTDWDKKVLTCLANHAAIAIQDAAQLTRLQAAQERQAVAETFAAVGDVAANLLHQLNNKVGAIPARIQAIEAHAETLLANQPRLAKNLAEIENNARHALTIVKDSMTHLQPIELKSAQIGPCLERAIAQAHPQPTIEITRLGLLELPPVVASEAQLTLVFYNLVDNALKAMSSQGTLRLQGRCEAAFVAVSVADNGLGIPDEILPHIFEFRPLYRERYGTQLGFGLWWVKKFVDRFGGRVEVDSHVGRGTTITVYLPIAETAGVG